MELDANVKFWYFFQDLILLMVQKSGNHHLAYTKPCKSWESNYQPQLVSLPDFSYQQYYYHDVKHIPPIGSMCGISTSYVFAWFFTANDDCLGWRHLTTCYTRKWLLKPKEVPFCIFANPWVQWRHVRLREFLLGGLLQYPYHPCMLYIYIHVP